MKKFSFFFSSIKKLMLSDAYFAKFLYYYSIVVVKVVYIYTTPVTVYKFFCTQNTCLLLI